MLVWWCLPLRCALDCQALIAVALFWYLVSGISITLKQGPGFCLIWGCPLSWAWQGIAGRGFPLKSSTFSWGNEVPRPCCWSSLLLLLGEASLPLPAGCLPDPDRSLLSVWKPPYKTGFFSFRVLFSPNENNPHPVNHHLGWVFFPTICKSFLRCPWSCVSHTEQSQMRTCIDLCEQEWGTVGLWVLLVCCTRGCAHTRNKDSFLKHVSVLEVPGGLPTYRKGLCCVRNGISGWSQLDGCFGQLLVFCRMNGMRGKKGGQSDGFSIKPSFNAGHSSLCPVFLIFTGCLSLDLKGLFVELKGYVIPCGFFNHKNFQRF